jgi:hypothetical protein
MRWLTGRGITPLRPLISALETNQSFSPLVGDV